MGWSFDFEPNFFCELAHAGFNSTSIEIATDNDFMVQVLTPCYEPERNVLQCLKTHVSKNVRKRAKRYSLTVDAAYDDVLLGCVRHHGEGWLFRGMRCLLRHLRQRGYTGSKGIRIATHSIELWDEHGELVAGDLGYTMGAVYVSQTGFHKEGTRGAGETHLVLMAALLYRLGHAWFDLGQARTYKAALGAETLDRAAWFKRFVGVRDEVCTSMMISGRVAGGELLQEFLNALSAAAQEEQGLQQPEAIERATTPPVAVPQAAAEQRAEEAERDDDDEENECKVQ